MLMLFEGDYMKKKIIAAALLFMSGSIANAATLGNQSSVNADFTVTGGCVVSGAWTANNAIAAGTYSAHQQQVGTLDVSLTGCSSQVYFEGAEKNSIGAPVATSPSNKKIAVSPSLTDFVTWQKDTTDNVFFTKDTLNDGDKVSVSLVNYEDWTAEAGKHTMLLNVGTYSI